MNASQHCSRLLIGIVAILFMICCAPCACPMAADAANHTGDRQSSVSFIRTDAENRSERVGDYDINENHEIAVATDEYINIYDENGAFLYGYSVSAAGGAYAIDFHTDGMDVYLLRREELIRLDNKGGVLSVSSVAADDSAVSEMKADMRKASKVYADCEYRLNASLTRLVKVYPNGEEQMIYETSPYRRMADFIFVAALLLIVFTIFCIFVKRKRSASSHSGNE